ncbi:hypothetical protein RND71_000717 [Anisodus tanguticus]|uniref:Pentatricopeptide repeat-containing protein n=1 Tax=Anisodus tanguticus TaxID=243964 RepID=A0AAE1SYW4_9SOLA|nr:hypothetical protein RND71_000717 [Anisodus tanguticus]
MKRRGIWPDDFTFAPLLKACVNLEDLVLGQGVHKHVVALGFERFGSIRTGILELQMSERTVVSWNLMISLLAQNGREKEALTLFHEIRNSEFEPDEATIVTVLPICSHLGELDLGRWIHSYVKTKGLYPNLVSVGNALVDFFGKSGELGVQLFDEMLDEGVRPNGSTFVGVLACCAHAGLVQRGGDLFDSMIGNHGRGGCLKEAHKLVRTMTMEPNAAILGALVSACRTHDEMELAECALKELIKLEPWNSGNYVLLSNIYADRGKWEEVEKARVLMRGNNIKKAPGQSTIV